MANWHQSLYMFTFCKTTSWNSLFNSTRSVRLLLIIEKKSMTSKKFLKSQKKHGQMFLKMSFVLIC